jgi:hypothetical protein
MNTDMWVDEAARVDFYAKTGGLSKRTRKFLCVGVDVCAHLSFKKKKKHFFEHFFFEKKKHVQVPQE